MFLTIVAVFFAAIVALGVVIVWRDRRGTGAHGERPPAVPLVFPVRDNFGS
jgi:hypothetical protein